MNKLQWISVPKRDGNGKASVIKMDAAQMAAKAKILFNYLYLRDLHLEKADLIIGFGHFDMKIPQHCARLYQEGYAAKVLFSGGRGAGSADLTKPEAVAFKEEFLMRIPDPGLSEGDIIIEDQSTNTGENIALSQAVLKNRNPEFHFERGITAVIAVASPYRQKRVYLTLQKNQPQLRVYNAPPPTDFDTELKLYAAKKENFITALIGELERIKRYPQRGFIVAAAVPPQVEMAYQDLKRIIKEG